MLLCISVSHKTGDIYLEPFQQLLKIQSQSQAKIRWKIFMKLRSVIQIVISKPSILTQ